MPRQRLLSFLAAFALLTVCCGRPAADRGAGPNVLIVVLDACRADRLGCYGYERETTPNIDTLTRDPDAVLYRKHYVQGAYTKPSTASLFTGLFVSQHGVLLGHKREDGIDLPGHYRTQAVNERFRTLSERFRAAGFHTFAVVKSQYLVADYGFSQGFEHYDSPQQLRGDKNRIAKILELVDDAPGPFFGYLHLAACHHPFPPKSRDAEFMERYGFDYDEELRKLESVDFTTAEIMHAINDRGMTLEPDDVRFLDLVYDAELRSVDRKLVAPLLEGLRKMGAYDDTLLILTADHGEELYDHEGYAHGHALWDEVVRVPLIVKFPAGRTPPGLPREVGTATQSIDLMPSLLEFIGHPAADALPGRSLFGNEWRDMAFSEIGDGWALVQGDYKLIRSGGDLLLFNLREDPGEHTNLAVTEPRQVASLSRLAEALLQMPGPFESEAPVIDTELDPEALEALRSLGYLQ